MRDVGFSLSAAIFRAHHYRSAAHSPFPNKPKVFGNRAPENRNVVRFLGRGGAECTSEHCPSGRCERAADCSDEGALFQRRGFGTRNLIMEKCNSICHPERSVVIGGRKADAFGNKLPWACAHMPPIAARLNAPSRKQNHAFALAHPCLRVSAVAGKVNAPHFYNGVP